MSETEAKWVMKKYPQTPLSTALKGHLETTGTKSNNDNNACISHSRTMACSRIADK